MQNYKEIDKTPFYCVRLIFAVVQKEIVVFRFVQNLFNLFKKSRDLQFPAFLYHRFQVLEKRLDFCLKIFYLSSTLNKIVATVDNKEIRNSLDIVQCEAL